jgi:hypothetical protein
MLWDAEDRSGFASTADLLVSLLRVAAALGATAACLSLVSGLNAQAGLAESDISRLIDFAQIAVGTYVAVVFFRWLATACLIAREVADDFEFFPRGAVASFFIPMVNLVLPYRIVKSMYEVSRDACRRGVVRRDGLAAIVPVQARAESENETGDVVDFWWASMLTMLFISALVVASGGSPLAPVVSVAADLALVCAAVAAVRLVRTITQAQLPAVAA